MIQVVETRAHVGKAVGCLVATTLILAAAVVRTTGCRSYGAWWAEGLVPMYVVAAAATLAASAYFFAKSWGSRHAVAWTLSVVTLGGPVIWIVFLADGLRDCPP
jgi:hypothetical protein